MKPVRDATGYWRVKGKNKQWAEKQAALLGRYANEVVDAILDEAMARFKDPDALYKFKTLKAKPAKVTAKKVVRAKTKVKTKTKKRARKPTKLQ